jgi:BirA family biotin operon repressor/biotin-[acetyl-CoA-carboxylase] ligase
MQSVKNQIIILDRVDSTNNYATGMIRADLAAHADAWFTYEQTNGKGRRGKVWKAEAGKNIMMSIAVIPYKLKIYEQFKLSLAVSIACFNFFKDYSKDNVTIKWPNDLFWNDRKAGGILIENIIKGNSWQWSVIGIGMNINQTEFDTDNIFSPVSLKQITGKDYDVIEMAEKLYEIVMKSIADLQGNGFEKMMITYNENLFCRGKKVKLKKVNIVFETTIKSVSDQGQLITFDSIERRFDFDEVEWWPRPHATF